MLKLCLAYSLSTLNKLLGELHNCCLTAPFKEHCLHRGCLYLVGIKTPTWHAQLLPEVTPAWGSQVTSRCCGREIWSSWSVRLAVLPSPILSCFCGRFPLLVLSSLHALVSPHFPSQKHMTTSLPFFPFHLIWLFFIDLNHFHSNLIFQNSEGFDNFFLSNLKHYLKLSGLWSKTAFIFYIS